MRGEALLIRHPAHADRQIRPDLVNSYLFRRRQVIPEAGAGLPRIPAFGVDAVQPHHALHLPFPGPMGIAACS